MAALGTIDLEHLPPRLEDKLNVIERKAIAVLEAAKLSVLVHEYCEAKGDPYSRAAFLARLRPKQPRPKIEGETVDALRALNLLLQVWLDLERWRPYETDGYRKFNNRPVTIARGQMRDTLLSVADRAFELGWIAHRLEVWPPDKK